MNQDDNRCAEDFKRQHLQRPLIPESIERDVREVERMLKMDYISAEQARKYLEDCERESNAGTKSHLTPLHGEA